MIGSWNRFSPWPPSSSAAPPPVVVRGANPAATTRDAGKAGVLRRE
ncbi:unnamed protein product [[Actinomadura] parvosata subsp. kistnae]|nr:unnamed protein product [Actinomadura parvosata subsp. kistnae]